jgi:DNA-binding transcriptional LysR family regulator
MPDIDLNLLRVFDTLMELRSVTRAADRLGLTQSAVSHALGRLRQQIDDRLFVRGPDGLQPTARAMEMASGVRDGLTQLVGALARSAFDPATAERRFTIAAGTYFCAQLVPALIERARIEAQGVSFRIVPVAEDLVSALDQGAIDVALAAFTRVPHRFITEPLFEEDMVWVTASTHPVMGGEKGIAVRPRVAIVTARPLDVRATVIIEGGLERQVIGEVGRALLDPTGEGITTVYDAQTALAIVARSDAVALVPRRAAMNGVALGGILVVEPETKGERITLSMLWHDRQSEDAGLAWLRDVLRMVAE